MELPFLVVEKESFNVLAYRIETTNQKQEGRKKIPECWNTFRNGAQQELLMSRKTQEPYGLLGISEYNIDSKDARRFAYYIGISSSDEREGDLVSYTVPKQTWAIFPCTTDTMGKVQVQAITKWLPKSKYAPLNKGYITGRMKSGAPDIECYLNEDGDAQVWIAVSEK
ncbi:GyrI-like domain-containing protein [Amedibacillus sp. YH-ame6]